VVHISSTRTGELNSRWKTNIRRGADLCPKWIVCNTVVSSVPVSFRHDTSVDQSPLCRPRTLLSSATTPRVGFWGENLVCTSCYLKPPALASVLTSCCSIHKAVYSYSCQETTLHRRQVFYDLNSRWLSSSQTVATDTY
jgi:hypothetical protein